MSKEIYRIIDVNINRACEGLRFIEDLLRFKYEKPSSIIVIKTLRKEIRKSVQNINLPLLNARDSNNDVGLDVSQQNKQNELNKDYLEAGFKRAQEALRVISESFLIIKKAELARLYEKYRFTCYSIEKEVFVDFNNPQKDNFDWGLYGITGEKFSKGRSNIDVVKAMIESGIKVIQYREKEKSLKEKLYECKLINSMCKDHGVIFLINDESIFI